MTLAGAIVASQIHWPGDIVTLNAKGLSQVSMTGSVTAKINAFAKSLTLNNASGQVDLVLPVPNADCDLLPPPVNTTCGSNGVEVSQPISAMWTAPRQLEVPDAAGSAVVVVTQTEQNGGGMTFALTGDKPLRLCVGQAADSAPLSLHIGSSDVTFPAIAPLIPTCSGLVVSFRSILPGHTSGFSLRGLVDTRTDLQGTGMKLAADTIRLTPHSTGADSTYDGGSMQVESDRQFGFTFTGAPPDLLAKDQVVNRANSVSEADVERLPTLYNHFNWISYLLTLVGALAGLVVWRMTHA